MTNGRILVVEDDPEIRELVRTVLADGGYEAVTATNGKEALAVVDRFPPDLILADVRMPIMNGWEFVRAYRARPGPHAPIVALTASELPEAREPTAPVDDLLVKPFQLDDLLDVVDRHVARRGQSRATAARTEDPRREAAATRR